MENKALAYPHMDPFREVRTPERNFGPARIGGVAVTPLARRLAGERGIDLSGIHGSGPHGRIVATDVEKAAPARMMSMPGGASAAEIKALYEGAAYEEVPLDSMRATIARRLVEAKQTIPHFYLTADLDVGRLIALRAEANAAAPEGEDGQPAFKLSLNDFIIAFLVSDFTITTLPIQIFSSLRYSYSPLIAVASTLFILTTFVGVAILARLTRGVFG